MPAKLQIKKGDKFGKLVILEEVEPAVVSGIKRRRFLCKCDCGNLVVRRMQSLVSGQTKSCGCSRIKHGMFGTRFYDIWAHMIKRCNNPNDESYKNYGGRGIKVCDEWLKFENFKKDMYESYLEHCRKYGEKNTTIERIDVNGDYCKENCRWATREEQAKNKRKVRKYKGICITDRCRRLGLNYNTIQTRIYKLGWSIEEALGFKERKNEK